MKQYERLKIKVVTTPKNDVLTVSLEGAVQDQEVWFGLE